jgi:hypothetical protein
MEMTVDERVRGEKALGLVGRFESLHLAFTVTCRSMWVFSAVVQISALPMPNLRKQLALSHAVASQLIGHDHARYIFKALQQASEESLCGFGIPAWLNENVEHDTLLIHRALKIMLHALDSDEHLVEMPFVPGPRTAASQTAGEGLAKFLVPTPNGLIGDDNTTSGQKQFNIPKAEAEHMVQPDGVADYLGGKAMMVTRIGRWLHAPSLVFLQADCQTPLT